MPIKLKLQLLLSKVDMASRAGPGAHAAQYRVNSTHQIRLDCLVC